MQNHTMASAAQYTRNRQGNVASASNDYNCHNASQKSSPDEYTSATTKASKFRLTAWWEYAPTMRSVGPRATLQAGVEEIARRRDSRVMP